MFLPPRQRQLARQEADVLERAPRGNQWRGGVGSESLGENGVDQGFGQKIRQRERTDVGAVGLKNEDAAVVAKSAAGLDAKRILEQRRIGNQSHLKIAIGDTDVDRNPGVGLGGDERAL